MQHEYTVTTPLGDVPLTTNKHHSHFDSIEDFLKAHQTVISNFLGGAHLAVNALGLYLQHGRRGARIK
jgi:hypothetical protein